MPYLGNVRTVLILEEDIEIREMVGLAFVGIDKVCASGNRGADWYFAVVLHPTSGMHRTWNVEIVPEEFLRPPCDPRRMSDRIVVDKQGIVSQLLLSREFAR